MPQQKEQHVVIVGGSLAGLMAALAIAEPGRQVTVLERAPSGPRTGGALGVDSIDLMRLLGPDRASVVAARIGLGGRRRAELPTTWQALHTGLSELVDDEPWIELHHDTLITSAGTGEHGAWVETASGSRVHGDVVVGADGHRSVVRAAIDPAHPDATFARYSLWLGIAGEVDLPRAPWPRGLDIRSSGPHYLLGYPLAGEDGSVEPGRRRLGWAWYDGTRNDLLRDWGAVVGEVVQHSVRPTDVPGHVLEALRAQSRDIWPAPWRDAIADSIRRREVTATPIAEYVPHRLVRGALVIVGDAAHVPTPMTGSGFATSLEDARVLATMLRDKPDPAKALAAYERARLADARDLVLGGQGFSRSFAVAP